MSAYELAMLPAGPQIDVDLPYFSVSYLPETPPKPDYLVTRLLLDSRDLPASTANPFQAVFFLGNPYTSNGEGQPMLTNVLSVELKALSFPKIANERYVILDIPALNDDNLGATNDAAHKTFAVSYFDSDVLTPGMHKPQKGADFYQKTIKYRPALNKLDRVDVTFRKYDGNVVTSSDVGGTGNVQYSMILEITSLNNRRW